jgi:aminopeptidase N
MAHPVRPDEYIEINNFYTTTVYEKGAEVIRMQHALLGPERFRQGVDLYFARHDGQAVTCDDFVQALQDASGVDLERFRRWYSQAGTPIVRARGTFDANARSYTLELEQETPPTPGQPVKQPFHIPVALGLIDPAGRDLLTLAGEASPPDHPRAVADRARARFVFTGIATRPCPRSTTASRRRSGWRATRPTPTSPFSPPTTATRSTAGTRRSGSTARRSSPQRGPPPRGPRCPTTRRWPR